MRSMAASSLCGCDSESAVSARCMGSVKMGKLGIGVAEKGIWKAVVKRLRSRSIHLPLSFFLGG